MKVTLYSEKLIPLTIIDVPEKSLAMLGDGYAIRQKAILLEESTRAKFNDEASTSLILDYDIQALRFKLPLKPVQLLITIDAPNWIKAQKSVPSFLPHQSEYLKSRFGIDV